MAPERARGDESGPFADLFSLGATLFAAVEGQGPFDRPDAMATLLALTTEPPAEPRLAGPLAPILLGLLDKDPGQRMTGWQARAALRQLLPDPGTTPAPRQAPPSQAAPPTTGPPPASPSPETGPPQSSPPGSGAPAGWPPPQTPRTGSARRPLDDVLARIDRNELSRVAAVAGRSFARGAAKAALAGAAAWQDSRGHAEGGRFPERGEGRTSADATSSSQPVFPDRPAQPGRVEQAGPAQQADPSERPDAPAPVRRSIKRRLRLPLTVVGLVLIGLVLGIALLVWLLVVALG
jgi:hypothetical protein